MALDTGNYAQITTGRGNTQTISYPSNTTYGYLNTTIDAIEQDAVTDEVTNVEEVIEPAVEDVNLLEPIILEPTAPVSTATEDNKAGKKKPVVKEESEGAKPDFKKGKKKSK